ncbi:unnamed protein product, partial [Ascophyllum nodosum]
GRLPENRAWYGYHPLPRQHSGSRGELPLWRHFGHPGGAGSTDADHHPPCRSPGTLGGRWICVSRPRTGCRVLQCSHGRFHDHHLHVPRLVRERPHRLG